MEYDQLSGYLKILLSFFPNTAMGYGLKLIVRLEEMGVGLTWSTFCKTLTVYDNLSVGAILIHMLLDALLFFIFALYIENIFPGTYGVSKPWYFPLRKEFWSRKKYQQFRDQNSDEEYEILQPNESQTNFEREPSGRRAGIEIRNLTKVFGNKAAVNNVSMNLYDGQITVLLGHNGAGN